MDTSPRPTSETIEKNRKIALTAVIACCVTLVIAICIGVWFYFRTADNGGRIYSNVYVAGVNVGDMKPQEAAAAVHAATDTSYTQDLVVTTNKGTLVFSPDKTGVRLDVDKAVDAAFSYGRNADDSSKNQEGTAHIIDLLPYLNLNTDYIRTTIHDFAVKHNGSLKQPSITENGDAPVLLPIPKDPDEIPQTLTITAGTPGVGLDEEALNTAVLDAYNTNDFSGISMDFKMTEPNKLDAKTIYSTYCISPIDATIDPKTYETTSEIWGYGVTMEELNRLLADLDTQGTIEIPLKYIPPAVTEDTLMKDMFQDTLASYESSYNVYNTSRSKNLSLAAEAINGTILMPGDTFSFNDVVGERTSDKGYESAGAYVSGGSVDQIGGGICQVASTIYYCALISDLEIVDREEHMYAVSYVPLGMDATINWGTIDFKFRNNTNHPIRMETWARDGEVHVALYGTEEKDYYVEMEYEVEKTYDWKTVKKKFPENNSKGYEDGDVVVDPHTGYDVQTYKCKYDKDTDELISRTPEAKSNFEKQDQVVCEIERPKPTQPEPTQPETTIPETTQPETTEPETSAPDTSEPADSSDVPEAVG